MMASPLSRHLGQLTDYFADAEKLKADEYINLDQPSALTIWKTLKLLAHTATNIEMELSILRELEVGRDMARTAEHAATGVLSKILTEARGNVIHADFRRNDDG